MHNAGYAPGDAPKLESSSPEIEIRLLQIVLNQIALKMCRRPLLNLLCLCNLEYYYHILNAYFLVRYIVSPIFCKTKYFCIDFNWNWKHLPNFNTYLYPCNIQNTISCTLTFQFILILPVFDFFVYNFSNSPLSVMTTHLSQNIAWSAAAFHNTQRWLLHPSCQQSVGT